VTAVIRSARRGDLPAIVGIIAAGTLRNAEDPSALSAYESAFEEIDGDPHSVALVAELEGEVVGTCQVFSFRHLQSQGGRCAELESMHVDEPYRNAGIGTQLLDAALQWARSQGCYRLQLTSNKVRTDAHRFYERHGLTASHEGFKIFL
jgi:GNAT superfamily N-acetyltransferase